MIRAQKVAGARRMRLRVAPMPEGEDPADLLTDGGSERMGELIERAVDLPVFQVEAAIGRADTSSPAGRDRALDEVAPVLAAMDADSVSRQELVRTVADRLDTDAGLVTRRIEREDRGGAGGGAGRRGSGGAGEGAGAGATSERAGASGAGADRDVHRGAGGGEGVPRAADARAPVLALMARALEWTRDHLDDPMAGLPREDEELVSVVTQLVMASRREPASREAMELNFLWLEQATIDDQIAAQAGGGTRPSSCSAAAPSSASGSSTGRRKETR